MVILRLGMDKFVIENIRLFHELFKGRKEVFAIRWEKDGKSGYVPAYDLNWDEFAKFKATGGKLKDFPHKTYSKLSEQRIINHLSGKEVIGIYPLLANESPKPIEKIMALPVEKLLKKTMKVSFDKILFHDACVSFPLFIDEVGKEIKFEIDNPDIRPEFEAIKDYLPECLRKNSLLVKLRFVILISKLFLKLLSLWILTA